MGEHVPAYRWTCPICSETTLGLPTMDGVGVEEQAANALTSHVRTSVGDGHGPEGGFPPGFDRDVAVEHVGLDGESDESGRRVVR